MHQNLYYNHQSFFFFYMKLDEQQPVNPDFHCINCFPGIGKIFRHLRHNASPPFTSFSNNHCYTVGRHCYRYSEIVQHLWIQKQEKKNIHEASLEHYILRNLERNAILKSSMHQTQAETAVCLTHTGTCVVAAGHLHSRPDSRASLHTRYTPVDRMQVRDHAVISHESCSSV